MTILITGANGFLGPHLMAAFQKNRTGVVGVARSGGTDYQYDLTDPSAVQHLMERVKPSLVIHAAAMTDVNKCEQNPDLAVRVNSDSTRNIVKFMAPDCKIINISTDMVYSGIGPHKEHSKSENPINMYGISKFMGEFEAGKAKDYLNIRTNIVGFCLGSKRPSSFVDAMVDKFGSGKPFQVFTDALFSPLSVTTLCSFLLIVANRKNTGTYNFGSTNGMSKSKFALILASKLGLSSSGARPVESVSLPNRIPRPLDTRLDTGRVDSTFNLIMPTLESELTAMCQDRQWIN